MIAFIIFILFLAALIVVGTWLLTWMYIICYCAVIQFLLYLVVEVIFR